MLTKKYVLNGNAGAYTDIPAEIACRYVEVREDEAAAGVGLDYKLPDDNFTAVNIVGAPAAGAEPQIKLGHIVMMGKGVGPVLGYRARTTPEGDAIPAAVLLKVRSKTAAATTIRVTFYE
jgi:hypothetical protein